jgi:hypothetical protein
MPIRSKTFGFLSFLVFVGMVVGINVSYAYLRQNGEVDLVTALLVFVGWVVVGGLASLLFCRRGVICAKCNGTVPPKNNAYEDPWICPTCGHVVSQGGTR